MEDMRQRILLLACLFFFSAKIFSQVPQEEVIERLYHTCKVWGYFKYHHSNITAYNINYPPVDWDDALLSSLNGIMTAKDKPSFQDSFNKLLFKPGPLIPYIDYWVNRGDSIKTKDFSWMSDNNYLTNEVKDTLLKIRSLFKNQTIGYFSWSDEPPPFYTPFIKFDNKYSTETNPSHLVQILGLFRYWNLIEYTYQFKPLISPSWNEILKKTLKEILEVKSTEEYVFVMKKLTANSRDSRAEFRQPLYDSFIGNSYLPFKLRYIDGKTIVTNKPDSIHEISIGDEVILIEEQPMGMVRDFYRTYAEGANSAAIERNIDEVICRGRKGYTFMTLKKTNGQSYSYKAFRSKENYLYFQNLPKTKSIYDTVLKEGCSFGIIDLRRTISNELTVEKIQTIWDKDAWILDLRGIPFIQFESFLIHFVYNGYKEYYFTREPNLLIPGEFYSQITIYDGYTNPKEPRYDKKIILLVDEYTQKSGEYDALCFMEREDVIVIGSTTDGAGAAKLAHVYLPGNIYTTYTFNGAQNKQKQPYYKIGVPLDMFVRPTVEDIRLGRDVVLEAALKCTNTRLNINQSNENISFQIYPNPFINELVVENKKSKTKEYVIYNMLGIQVAQGNLIYGKNFLNLDYLSNGVYLIRIENYSFKLTKE